MYIFGFLFQIFVQIQDLDSVAVYNQIYRIIKKRHGETSNDCFTCFYSQINGMRFQKKISPVKSSYIRTTQTRYFELYPNKELRILDEGILWSEQKTRPSLIQHFVY